VHISESGDQTDRVVRELHAQISSWTPKQGPRWNDVLDRAEKRPFQLFRVYAFAGTALAAVIVAAYMAIAGLGLGGFSTAPVENHSSVTTTR
jgi:hypothetical protein